MSVAADSGRRPPWSGDAGARRLFASVRGACGGGEELPVRLEAGLRAALGTLAAQPGLARLLTVRPYIGGEEGALDGQREWIDRFGGLLRDAAADDPRAHRTSSFLAPYLIGGVQFQIGLMVLDGEGSDLLRLLPGTLEALLAYWFEPGERRDLARAAIDA